MEICPKFLSLFENIDFFIVIRSKVPKIVRCVSVFWVRFPFLGMFPCFWVYFRCYLVHFSLFFVSIWFLLFLGVLPMYVGAFSFSWVCVPLFRGMFHFWGWFSLSFWMWLFYFLVCFIFSRFVSLFQGVFLHSGGASISSKNDEGSGKIICSENLFEIELFRVSRKIPIFIFEFQKHI